MLIIKHNLADLDFPQLMAVYAESTVENADEFYPELPKAERLPKAHQDFHDYLESNFFALENVCCCIWEVEGRYAAALRLKPYQDGLLLEALETRPDCRRQGCATALIQSVRAAVPGKIYAHIHKQNVPSLATHAKCGFRRIAEQAIYASGTINDRCCTVVLD